MCKKMKLMTFLSVIILSGKLWAIDISQGDYVVKNYASYSSAGLERPGQMIFDDNGNLYIAHMYDRTIWKVDNQKQATLFISNIDLRGMVWGGGTAFGNYIFSPDGDPSSAVVNRIDLNGTYSSFANFSAPKHGPSPIAIDRTGNYGGNMFVATSSQDRTYEVTTSGSVSLFADFPGWRDGGGPADIVFDTTGNYGGLMLMTLYFNNSSGNEYMSGLWKLDPSGSAARLVPDTFYPLYMDIDPTGSFDNKLYVITATYVGQLANEIWKVNEDGSCSLFAQTTKDCICDITFGSNGAMYISEYDQLTETVTISEIAANKMVAHWKFDETSANIAYDTAGTNDGTVNGAIWDNGIVDGALRFDGVDDWVYIDDSNDLDLLTDLTVSLWINPDDLGDGGILGKYDNWGEYNYAIWYERGSLYFQVGNSGPSKYDSNQFETRLSYSNIDIANKWYHITGTYNSSQLKLYVNGILVDSTAETRPLGDGYNPLCIGNVKWDGLNSDMFNETEAFFDGLIDDVRIYNYALDSTEVSALYGEAYQTYTYHVDKLNGSDTNSGLSQETAFATIQQGINSANDGDTVLIWPGTYDEQANLLGKAITVKSADQPAVISNTSGYAFTFSSGEQNDTILQNVIISNGQYAAYVDAAAPTIKNLTIANNQAGINSWAGADPHITNCIFYNNYWGDLFDCTADNSWIADVNNTDPGFVDAENGDYHLLSRRGRYWPQHQLWVMDDVTSPCIDAGDPNDNPASEKIPNGARINMGAYGGTKYASMSEMPVKADINSDGIVDLLDYAIFAEDWLWQAKWKN